MTTNSTKKIGIDLRVLQIGHQYRGIGAHMINLLEEFTRIGDTKIVEFTFYTYKEDPNPIDELGLNIKGLKYSVIEVNRPAKTSLHPRLSKLSKVADSLGGDYSKSDIGLPGLGELDLFLQLDFALGVPKKNIVKSVLIAYDLIPLVLNKYYLPRFGHYFNFSKNGIKTALKGEYNHSKYRRKISIAAKRATKIIAISDHTKQDFVKYLGINPSKIETIHLGVKSNGNQDSNDNTPGHIKAIGGLSYNQLLEPTKVSFDPTKTRYVFFVGGADRRRRVEDIVRAVDLLNSEGQSVKLVLAGYDFKSLKEVPDPITKRALMDASYKNAFVFLGYISGQQRQLLYENALAFIFPSVYEGFGLPILEAMEAGCPSITYDNSSIREIAGDDVVYAKPGDSKSMRDAITSLQDSKNHKHLTDAGHKRVGQMSWQLCAEKTLKALLDVAS